MKDKFFSLLKLALFATLSSQLSSALAQGSLTPPGGPAPMMKSLDQVEPRTPITSLPIVISQGGSYYLTRSFALDFAVLDAITIRADNVTVDLCGFTIQQTTNAVAVAGVRIGSTSINTPVRNAVVRNGTITGFAAAGVTSQGGRNCLIENLHVTGCNAGISFQAFGTAGAAGNTIRRCRTTENTLGSGVIFLSGAANIGNVIEDCESLNNSTGFSLAGAGNLIVGCRASGNTGNNYTIAAGNRMGLIVLPGVNGGPINGASGATGTGTSDPFANLSY